MKRFFKEFRAEIIIALLLIIGIILVIGDFGVRQSSQKVLTSAQDLFGSMLWSVSNYIGSLSSFEILGFIFISLAFVYLYSRIRYRFRRSPTFMASVCPECGSKIRRVHRSYIDRFLSGTLMPGARRYQCEKTECGWSGLRHQRYRLDQIRESEIPESQKTPSSR
jgi:hypothetical protein